MLSRVADSLFWLSRNVERAETISRILDVTSAHSVGVDSSSESGAEAPWAATLRCAALSSLDAAGEPIEDVLAWCAFEASNSSSIVSCVRVARANAIGIRAMLSTEAWLALNTLYLYVEEQSPVRVLRSAPSRFLRRVRDAAQGFAGVCDATLMHADAWNYLQIGRFLERAYMTARMLSELGPEEARWIEGQRLLEMCCAHEPFMQTMHQTPRAHDAVAFIIGSADFPRSVRFCVREIDAALRRLSRSPAGTYANEAEREVARLRARLDFTPVDELIAGGVRSWARDLTRNLERATAAIQDSYTPSLAVAL
jgi:uncharacterized alpha-E superfamily protein